MSTGQASLLLKFERALSPLATAAILALIGAIAIWTHHAWLVPSLGAAAFIQTMMPDQVAARPWSMVVGQFIGLAAGYAGVYAAGAQGVPPLTGGHALVWARVEAVGIAVALTAIAQALLRAKNPAGGATTLLMALGTEPPTRNGALLMGVGIILVSLLGEACRFGILAARRPAVRAGDRQPPD